jgi:Kef-type K+ transport system membrane component KefB
MSDETKIYLIAGAAAAISLVVWIALVAIPAWTSYSRLRDRLLAMALSVYVLVAFVVAGAGIGAIVLWYYDRL